MEHILLKKGKYNKEDNLNVMFNLNIGELKILYNACVDILNRHPEMISYRNVAEKLEQVILNHTN